MNHYVNEFLRLETPWLEGNLRYRHPFPGYPFKTYIRARSIDEGRKKQVIFGDSSILWIIKTLLIISFVANLASISENVPV